MHEYSQLSDFDIILYYGENDLDLEIQSEILAGLIQPKRTLFYNRSEGCGIAERENFPNSLSMQIAVRYAVASWASLRNTYVTDGTIGPDRRAVISQNSVSFENEIKGKGELNITVLYIPLKDAQSFNTISIPIGK